MNCYVRYQRRTSTGCKEKYNYVESSLIQRGRSVGFLLRYLIVINKSISRFSHTLHWSVRTCRKPASQTDTFFLVDIFLLNGANAKSCVFEKK